MAFGITYVVAYNNYIFQEYYILIWIICIAILHILKYINLIYIISQVKLVDIKNIIKKIYNSGTLIIMIIEIGLIIWSAVIYININSHNIDYPEIIIKYFKIISIIIYISYPVYFLLIIFRYIIYRDESGYKFSN